MPPDRELQPRFDELFAARRASLECGYWVAAERTAASEEDPIVEAPKTAKAAPAVYSDDE